MKPFDENDLIAYHLNELPLRQRRELERALKVDADLFAQSESIAETLRGFKGHSPFDLDPRLHGGLVEWSWKVLSPALPRYPSAKPTFFRRHLPILTAAGLAFAAVSVMVVRWHHTSARRQSVSHHLPVDAPKLTPLRPDLTTTPRTLPLDTPSEVAQARQRRTAGLLNSPETASGSPHGGFAVATRTQSTNAAQVNASAVASPNLPATPLTASVISSAPTMPVSGVLPSAAGELASGSSAQIVAAGPTTKGKHVAGHHNHTTDVTLAMGGTLIRGSQSSTYAAPSSQGATHAVIAMASIHQQFLPAAGYRFTLSYTRPDFQYGYGNVSSINGKVYEAAGTYVFQGPSRGRLSTSAEAGIGVMKIVPTIKDVTTGSNMRIAGVFGVAADFALSKRIGIHAAYRGQVFTGPDFQYTGTSAPINTSKLLSNEPSLGITYRFSHR